MIPITQELIKEIADNMLTGCRCYVHTETGQLIAIPDDDVYESDLKELFADDLKELKKNKKFYKELDKPESRDSFEFMVNFTEQLSDDNPLKHRLALVLEMKSPFSNFNHQIDNSGEYRQQWFTFKDEAFKQWVIDQFNRLNWPIQ